MKIFITGGTGFVGRPTVEELRRRGHRLLVLSRTGGRATRGVEFLKGDISNVTAWKKKLVAFRPDAVVHLAWQGIPDFSAAMCARNLAWGLQVMEAAVEAKCKKIVATGSCFEYGDAAGRIEEGRPIRPHNAFSAAKHALHIMGKEIAHEHNMGFVWLRPFYIYGPGQRTASLIPHIIASGRSGSALAFKTPLAQNDFVYVGDVAEGIADAVAKGKDGSVYDLGSGKLTSIKEVTSLVYGGLKQDARLKEMGAIFKGQPHGGSYADLRAAKRDLGWRPRTSIEKGIEKTIQYKP